MSQEHQILNHLRTQGPIDPLQALNLYGCFRLAARIYDLRFAGWVIETEEIEARGKKFARYRLKEKRQ